MIDSKKTELSRSLNSLDVIVVAFGAMIGWGWVVSSGQWISSGGVLGTVLGFLIGGLMIFFVGLTYAELTTAMPKTGGEQNFSYAAFGPTGSFICTWALVLSYVGVVCFEACSFPTIIQYLFPGFLQGYLYNVAGFPVYASWLAVAIATAAFIVYINYIGTKRAAKLQTILTCVIGGVGILLVIASAITGNIDNVYNNLLVGDTPSLEIKNVFKLAIMTPFFLFGFDIIPQAAEEIKVPLKRLGKIMLFSIVLAVGFYALVTVGIGNVMSKEDIVDSMAGSGLVTADAMALAFGNSDMAKVLIFAGLCGIVTTWISFLLGGSRVLFAMAQARMIPQIFGKLHTKYKTPYISIIFLGVISILSVFFGRVMLIWIVDAANFACCLAYCVVAMSFWVLRKKRTDLHRPYRVHNWRVVGVLAIVMSGIMATMYLIPGTNCSFVWQEWIIVGGWTVIGILLAIRGKRLYKEDFCSGMDF